jgi:hypothetical protein
MISMIWKLRTPLLIKRKRMWRRPSMKKLNSFIIIIAGLRHDMEKSVATLDGQCFEFPTTSATVGDMLDWFRMEVQALSIAFAKSN